MGEPLTEGQHHALQITERVASIFSLLGATFIILTFILSPAFRKPVNRLIFYASWGNMFGNLATLISQSGVKAGPDAALCQFQGFLIQMFFVADALWNLAMAINVYLTLFKKYNAQQLKALEWRYHLLCYGTPFVIALVYCFVDTQGRALTLYVLSGREIFRKRSELRAFRHSSFDSPFSSYKTTEVCVTSELAHLPPTIPVNCFDKADPSIPHSSPNNNNNNLNPQNTTSYEQYSTTINSSPPSSDTLDPSSSPRTSSALGHHHSKTTQTQTHRAALEANTAAWHYTKVALLFFVSLCVTWIPSSINRIYDLAHPDDVSYPLNFVSAIVLPLMGFWNGVIYVATTRQVCVGVFWDLVERWAPVRSKGGDVGVGGVGGGGGGGGGARGSSRKDEEAEKRSEARDSKNRLAVPAAGAGGGDWEDSLVRLGVVKDRETKIGNVSPV
ncbi:MAG: hypothetical protein Q9220_005667 [cf. Caloplaca sp. 1 TL-2023]